MSDSKSNTLNENDDSLAKAVEMYKKIYEEEDMPDEKQKQIAKMMKTIEERKIITRSVDHKPIEIKNTTDTISTGPPTLTRFEKARIMGSRALQLSLGAPPYQ
jgi:DNA-directed RNA polymerase I, II, and III subunit RPABC2